MTYCSAWSILLIINRNYDIIGLMGCKYISFPYNNGILQPTSSFSCFQGGHWRVIISLVVNTFLEHLVCENNVDAFCWSTWHQGIKKIFVLKHSLTSILVDRRYFCLPYDSALQTWCLLECIVERCTLNVEHGWSCVVTVTHYAFSIATLYKRGLLIGARHFLESYLL